MKKDTATQPFPSKYIDAINALIPHSSIDGENYYVKNNCQSEAYYIKTVSSDLEKFSDEISDYFLNEELDNLPDIYSIQSMGDLIGIVKYAHDDDWNVPFLMYMMNQDFKEIFPIVVIIFENQIPENIYEFLPDCYPISEKIKLGDIDRCLSIKEPWKLEVH